MSLWFSVAWVRRELSAGRVKEDGVCTVYLSVWWGYRGVCVVWYGRGSVGCASLRCLGMGW